MNRIHDVDQFLNIWFIKNVSNNTFKACPDALKNINKKIVTSCYTQIFKIWSDIIYLQSLLYLLQGRVSLFFYLLISKDKLSRLIKFYYYRQAIKLINRNTPILNKLLKLQILNIWCKVL
jgi:hypothetical protein